eukprot:11285384-Alexandrium_andersonii.AAC.1
MGDAATCPTCRRSLGPPSDPPPEEGAPEIHSSGSERSLSSDRAEGSEPSRSLSPAWPSAAPAPPPFRLPDEAE